MVQTGFENKVKWMIFGIVLNDYKSAQLPILLLCKYKNFKLCKLEKT